MLLKSLKKSTLSIEGHFQVSQLIKIPILLSINELSNFLECLTQEFPELGFYNTFGVVKENEGILSPEEFEKGYGEYIQILQSGQIPDTKTFHAYFALAMSMTSDVFYEIPLANQMRIIKPNRPAIQLQPHHMIYSPDSGSVYSMAYSQESITFGFQLSYPNVYQDPHTHEIVNVDESPRFPNTSLFKKIRLWVREYTMATPFMIHDKKVNYPIRLGKECFPWINNHIQLKMKNLYVNQRNT